ncbi:pickpocket protein 28-like [Anopheles darlingi]|uniref:pickpocket protein 28-like n=1 Tax=Anopheles darlingi TaxID=43151 RepID=UPI0021002434|nr:pickpocket protein 28-like [Anopheles darlingi]
MRAFRRQSCHPAKAEVFQEYCTSSSIHGVQYFDANGRTSCERFWWLVVFLLSMGGCCMLIYKTFCKWEESPIIVTFSEKTTPVWEIPFPAITICPETKVQSKKLNFTAEMQSLLSDVRDGPNASIDPFIVGQLKVVTQVCHIEVNKDNVLYSINGTNEMDIVNVLRNISLDEYHLVQYCSFDDHIYVCNHYMQETITDEGVCYTFNIAPPEQIFRKGALHTKYKYMENARVDRFTSGFPELPVVPVYSRGSGIGTGLILHLKQSLSDIDYMCTGFAQGYKLILHDSKEYPQASKRNIRIPLGHEINIALKPQIIETTESASSYGWKKRQCFFDYERQLRFFQHYTQDNCELECLTNKTLLLCECVRFSMPHDNDTQVCSLGTWKWNCMLRTKNTFRPKSSARLSDLVEEYSHVTGICNCLPACKSTHYDLEITQSSLDIERFMKANSMPVDNNDEKYAFTTLEIYFKESHFITSKRTELYGFVDLLANCGGLLGLFMGVSFLSLIEICYFLTIRPFSKIRNRQPSKSISNINEANNLIPAVVSKN